MKKKFPSELTDAPKPQDIELTITCDKEKLQFMFCLAFLVKKTAPPGG